MSKIALKAFFLTSFLLSLSLVGVPAASVTVTGYTNSFSSQPPAADWSTAPIAGAAADITTPAALDAAIQNVAAASVTAQAGSDSADPPALLATAVWSSAGQYLQTRPTGNGVTLLMCTLINNIGGDASAITIGYDFAKVALAAEEVEGQRAYYSLTGAAGSWVVIPSLSSASPGHVTANVTVNWAAGATLYLLWADDNGSPSPDTANQIDNFSVAATPATLIPAAITSQPQSQSVSELAPVSFTVTATGNPSPTFQWYKNNAPIPGATAATYQIAAAPLSDNQAQFKVVAANTVDSVNYSVTSAPPAVLTVAADTVKPVLLHAFGAPPSTVSVDFSEPLRADTANVSLNYAITSSVGNLTISSALLSGNGTNVILTTSPQTVGALYTLIVNGIRDQSAASNQIAPNSITTFTPAALTSSDVGSPALAGSSTQVPGGYDVTGGGSDISGTSDQFQFNYQVYAGDFDVRVRLQSFSQVDAWAKAGLMARENVTGNSRYAASFATPSVSGCFFQFRTFVGGTTTNVGSYPVTYPNNWLRLRRVGGVFTGFASVTGESWVQLGSFTMASPPGTMLVGMAVTSRAANQTAVGQFRSFENVVGDPPVGGLVLDREPLSASSRRTGLVISEIMYHPPDFTGLSNRLEFIELFNSEAFEERLGGFRISGAVNYTFPAGTVLGPGRYLVVAHDPSALQSYYGISGVLGPWVGAETNGLPGGSGNVRLRNRQGAVLLEVNYEGKSPWPLAADGAGHSLVLARASYGEGNPKAWAASDSVGGSPGGAEPYTSDPLRTVVINEFLAHTDLPQVDYIELYNHSRTPVDLSGVRLADEASVLNNPAATTHFYRIPNGTIIGPTGFVYFTETTLGFALSSAGERLYLINSNQTRVVDAVDFDSQANGVSMGRWPDGSRDFFPLASLTPGAPNGQRRLSPVVINEIMYAPISGNNDDEYVELYNRSTGPVNIGGWKLADGVSYTFPSNTVINAGAYIVVAKSKTNLLAHYSNLNSTNTFGNFSGSLANAGERIALTVPDVVVSTNAANVITTNTIHIAINEVTYGDGGRWGNWSDGGGSSLELTDPDSDNRQPANWADSDESAKSQWTTIEFTGPSGAPPTSETLSFNGDSLQIFSLGINECLIDDIEVRVNNGNNLVANPGFESGTNGWTIFGSHDMSTIENVGFSGTKSLHIRAASRGDNGANSLHTPLSPAAAGQVTLRAKMRWLRGWPETMMRLRGGSAEAFGRMNVPLNLGTPGAPNSRLLVNAGPAIYDASHTPVLPAANENVVVSCKVNDPDGIASVTLRYRNESGATTVTKALFTSQVMTDNGSGGDAVAGDGIYSATLLGRPAGSIVSFYIEAIDSLGATNLFPQDVFPPANLPRCFPLDAVTRECVLRWGDTQMLGSFATYHLWLTFANSNRWALRTPQLNNSAQDGTFVYNNYRAVYNSLPQFAGSPWHRGAQTQGPAGAARVDFVQNFPPDDAMLGSTDFVLNNPGNPDSPGPNTSDLSAQTEQTSYLIFNEIGLVYNHRRYVHHFVNGNQRSTTGQRPGNFIFEDSQQPNQDMVNEWFPDDPDGELWKIEDWFEFPDNGFDFVSNNDADLQRRTIMQNGQPTLYPAPYRFMFRKRSLGPGDSANDYTNIFKMIDAVSPVSPSYSPGGVSASAPVPDVNQFNRIINNEQWMRIFAVQRTVGNWDSFGYNRGKNDYSYIGKKNGSTFSQLTWDIDFTMGVGGDGSSQGFFDRLTDTRMTGIYNTPALVRAYWRGFYDIAYGPLNTNFLAPIVLAKQAALQQNNVNVDPSFVNTIISFAAARRTYIIQQFNNLTNAFNVNGPASFSTNAEFVTISGYAPIFAKDVAINGLVYPVTWTSVTGWVARVVLSNGVNNLTVQSLDRTGATNGTRTLAINYTGPTPPSPEGSVVFNEIMYAPTIPGAEYIEIYNRTNAAFNLTGWRVNGLDYEFPDGTVIAPGQFLVLTRNQSAFMAAYGTNSPVFDIFYGNLDPDGETLALLRPSDDGYSEVVVDKVRYENRLPWSVNANSGTSLQLIDSSIDNSRSSDWAAGAAWLNVTRTANISTATNLLVWLTSAGNCFIDDISIVATNEGSTNIVLNGDFESDLSGPWVIPAIYSGSYITNGVSHSGSRSLFINGTIAGSGLNVIQQWMGARVPTNAVCTLSYWILLNTNAVTVRVRTLPGSAIDTTAVAQSIVGTPGANNIFASSLPAYDPLWLNELQASNVAGITDNFGDRDPWVEIYNGGSNTLSLDGYYLSASYSGNLLQWPFPNGVTIPSHQFKLVWLDGEPQESVGVTHLHANFRLPETTGTVALVRTVAGAAQITDYLTYSGLGAGLSYGDYPDGQPFVRRIFQSVTPSGTNISRSVNVFINEWMAGNTTNSFDPADGDFNDWFELYNAGDEAVDLSGYYLTDNLGAATKFQVPLNSHYIIPAGGYLLVWADAEPEQNSAERADLHVSFRLSSFLGSIGLFAPDGESQIDAISYDQQTDNVSQGRCADGAAPPFVFFTPGQQDPSPGAANHCGFNNTAPTLGHIGDRVVRVDQTLNFNALASDPESPPQTLTFSLQNAPLGAMIGAANGIFTWTPTAAQANTTNHVTVRVSDNGTPPLSDAETIVIVALPKPKAGIVNNGGTLSISFDTIPGRVYRVEYKNNLDEAAWQVLTPNTPASGTTMTVPDVPSPDRQRFYRIIETN